MWYIPPCRGNGRRFLTTSLQRTFPAEEGCLRYDYFLSLQNDTDILLIEEWMSPEHQQRHVEQPHMELLRQLKGQYIADAHLGHFSLES